MFLLSFCPAWRAWEEEDVPLEDEDYHDLYENLREIDPVKMEANVEWPPNEGREAEFQAFYETEHQKEERERKAEEEKQQKEEQQK